MLMVMFSNLMLSTLNNSLRVSARSAVREEMARISGLIKRDIRSAQDVINCGNPDSQSSSTECTLLVDGIQITWRACTTAATSICKYDAANNVLNSSSANFQLNTLTFDSGFESTTDTSQRNILVTIISSHPNTRLGIENMVFQSTISTRNYDLTFSLPLR